MQKSLFIPLSCTFLHFLSSANISLVISIAKNELSCKKSQVIFLASNELFSQNCNLGFFFTDQDLHGPLFTQSWAMYMNYRLRSSESNKLQQLEDALVKQMLTSAKFAKLCKMCEMYQFVHCPTFLEICEIEQNVINFVKCAKLLKICK